MPQYWIEVSPNNRAGCKDTVCKANQAKILKGELRFGTWVEISEHGSWGWKHWGCVSGSQMMNLQDACKQDDGGYDFDAIDGYDELEEHPEVQEKIRRCVKQGHVDAADFKGDPEKNKPGEKGIRLTAKQKAAAEAEANANASAHDDDRSVSKKAIKRSRKKDDIEASEEEPAPKRTRVSKAAKSSNKDEELLSLKKTKRARDDASIVRKSKASSAVKAIQEEEVAAKKGLNPPKAARKKAGSKKEGDETVAQDRDHVEEASDNQKPVVTAKKPRKSSTGAAGKSSMKTPKVDNGGEPSDRKVRRNAASAKVALAVPQPTGKTSSKREVKGKAAAEQPVAEEEAGQRRRSRSRKA